jgi:hypothetical protein
MGKLSISMILLCFVAFTAQAQQNNKTDEQERLAKTPQGVAVIEYNNHEVALLKDPHNADREKEMRQTTEPDSSALRDVLDLLDRYRTTGAKLTPGSSHGTRIISVQVNGNSATVKTLEDPDWTSTSGRTYKRQSVPHTYTLKKSGERWTVSVDEFDL